MRSNREWQDWWFHVWISKLKWMGMGEFNSDDHYIYYCGQESHRRNGVALIKSLKRSTWLQSQKWQNDYHSFLKQSIQHHSNPSLYSNHKRWRSWSQMVLWRPTRSFRTNTKKDVLFITCVCVLSHFSHVWPFATLWTVARQAPLFLDLFRQEYWSELPCPPPGDLPDSGIEHMSLISPALGGGS